MTSADYVASVLRRRIIDGGVAPGTRLAESAVARKMGVSRVPVREALFALERDGLVEFSETGRAFAKELSRRDFEELLVLRVALEPLAARLAAPALKADSSTLERNVRATRRARTMKDVTLRDLDFHELILQASGHSRLLKLWRSLRGELELWLGRLHRTHEANHADTRSATAGFHEEIIRGFRNGSPSACERQLRNHILGWRAWLPANDTPARK